MSRMLLIPLAAVQLALCAHCSGGPPPPRIPFAPRRYVCYRTAEAMTIDGRMDEGVWAAAPWTDPFVDIQGDLEPAPYLDTRVKMLWDDTYFYFFAELEDPHVRATFTERDSYIFWEDSDIEIFIDPDGDTHSYFEVEENAFGTYWDLSLSRPYRDGGFGDEENWVWSPQGLINMHYPEMWGLVQFSEHVSGTGTEDFLWSSLEDAKWALRQVYYREHARRGEQGSYTDRFDELGVQTGAPAGYTWPPELTATSGGFAASTTDTGGTHTVHIRQDSRVWVEELEPQTTNVQDSTWGRVKTPMSTPR